MEALAPAGRSARSTAAETSALAVPRSLLFGVADTVALRRPCTVVTDEGPSTSSTVASVSSRTGPEVVGTVSAESSSTVVGGSSLAR